MISDCELNRTGSRSRATDVEQRGTGLGYFFSYLHLPTPPPTTMVKREKTKAKALLAEEEDSQPLSKRAGFVFSDSEDEEANQDLSLRIVEKAKSRAARAAEKAGEEVSLWDSKVSGGEDIVTTELVSSLSSKKKRKVKKVKQVKKTKDKQSHLAADSDGEVAPKIPAESGVVGETQTVNLVEDEVNASYIKCVEVGNLPEGVENSDNAVLRRLLRGPRYFDPPESSWGTCFKCGEDGHTTANCKSVKRKKPCFICGDIEHDVKQCVKAKDCFICNESGHRAKDCPKKFLKCSKSSEFCLKCGGSGHTMPSCNNDYSPDDLKEIQCYVCKSYGHLCCVNYFDPTPGEASCYKCGQMGHTGPDCRTSQSSTAGEPSPRLCFICGSEGHFARECTNAKKGNTARFASQGLSCFICGEKGHFAAACTITKKVKKRNRELSTPKKKPGKEGKGQRAVKSATQGPGNARKKKKIQFDDGDFTSPRILTKKSGWVADRPGDYSYGNHRAQNSHGSGYGDYSYDNHQGQNSHGSGYGDYSYGNARGVYSYGTTRSHYSYANGNGRWQSPATPIRNHMISTFNDGGYHSISPSYERANDSYPAYTYTKGSAGASRHISSASRFGNISGDGRRRGQSRW